MRILFLNAYFYPEVIAFTHLEKDILQGLIEAGHTISVVCPIPTRGIDAETAIKYKTIKKEMLENGHIQIQRFWAPREGRNPLIRAFRYFWCNLRECQIAKKYKDVDLIFTVSTPPTQGLLGAKLAKKFSKKYKKNVPFVYNLQDVFPDSLVTTGLTKQGSLIWKIGRKIEDYTYKHADKIIVISESFKRNIMEKGVPENKIVVVSNWIDTEMVKPVVKQDNRLYEEYGIDPDKFTVVYAGNFGVAQGADVVIQVAEFLQSEPNIQFVIFGGGPEFESVCVQVKEKQLQNVMIHRLLPQERVPEVYSLGDVALITCKAGVGNSGMPSKTWSIMACNTPIIASFDTDSELAEILQEADAGICVEPENACALADAILAHYANGQAECHCREYVQTKASKDTCVAKYVEILKTALEETSVQ